MTRSAPPDPRLEIASTIRIVCDSLSASGRSPARRTDGRGGRCGNPHPNESAGQEDAKQEHINIDAESEVVTAGIHRERDDKCNERKQRHSLPGPNGLSERALNEAHLQPHDQPPYDRTENPKIHPHLPE